MWCRYDQLQIQCSVQLGVMRKEALTRQHMYFKILNTADTCILVEFKEKLRSFEVEFCVNFKASGYTCTILCANLILI